jgi:hypothetical protein
VGAIASGAAEMMATGQTQDVAQRHEEKINKTFDAFKGNSKQIVRNFSEVITNAKEMYQETMNGKMKYCEACLHPLVVAIHRKEMLLWENIYFITDLRHVCCQIVVSATIFCMV